MLDPKRHLADLLRAAARQLMPDAVLEEIPLERPRQPEHGDYASSLALQLAKQAGRKPRELAEQLRTMLPPSERISAVEIAGPGFLNFRLRAQDRFAVVHQVLGDPAAFGRSQMGRGTRLQVEFVSSNPTGPLHVGHGRGAAFGASLSNLLAFAGYQVQREYYVNDAGRQMDILTLSTWLRYLALHGIAVPFPANAYQGDYVINMARGLQSRHADSYCRPATALLQQVPVLGQPLAEDAAADEQRAASLQLEVHTDALIANAKALLGPDWAQLHADILAEQLDGTRADLLAFGVQYDCWFSEQSLYHDGSVARVVEQLARAGHLYRKDGALWFRSTDFGDDKDRVVQRENGLYTYFASDIAYHDNKFKRGFEHVLNVWGADHHGYIPRVKAALQALGYDPARLEIAIVQFVSLYRHGEKVQMSTRKGQFDTLNALREETGTDAARFFYVLRKSDQHLDFDLSLATTHSNDNPVYYVQYACARIHSVLVRWGGDVAALQQVPLDRLGSPSEVHLTQVLAGFPGLIEQAAADRAPHSVAFYLRELAAAFHSCYNAEAFLLPEDAALTAARLALVAATGAVLRTGLGLLGVSAPERM